MSASGSPGPARAPGAARRVLLRIAAMAQKEVSHILRDRQVLAFSLVLPPLLLILFGYAISFDIEHVPLAVVDEDRGPESRALLERFTASGTFRTVARVADAEAGETLFRAGMARATLVIPPGYGRRVARGEPAAAQLLIDGSDGTTASIALGYADAVALTATQARIESELTLAGGRLEPPVDARLYTLFNPALRSAIFLVPGLIVFVLAITSVMLTALTVAREYERGSMEQLFATPVGRLEIILGKLGPYFLIGVLDVLLLLVVGLWLFDLPVRGSLALLAVTAALFLLAMLMQGLVISTLTRSQMVASQVGAVSALLPSLLLSGFVFPIENMPWPLQALSFAAPARYLVRALRAILLRGNGVAVIWPDLMALAFFFLLLLAVSVKRFRRRVA